MTIDVTREIEIKKWAVEVAAFAAHPDNAPKWLAHIKSVDWKSPPPLRVGTRFVFNSSSFGRKIAMPFEVIKFAPGEQLIVRNAGNTFPKEIVCTWRPSDMGGTHMKMIQRGELTGLSRIFSVFSIRVLQRSATESLARLKTVIEAR
jgi:hypothetical protein